MTANEMRAAQAGGLPLRGGAVVVTEGERRPGGQPTFLVRCGCGAELRVQPQNCHDDWACDDCHSRGDNTTAGALGVKRVDLWLAEHGYRDVRLAPEGRHPDLWVATTEGVTLVEVRQGKRAASWRPDVKRGDSTEYYATVGHLTVASGGDPFWWRVSGQRESGRLDVEPVASIPPPPPPRAHQPHWDRGPSARASADEEAA